MDESPPRAEPVARALPHRPLLVAAGVLGALGVAGAAAASHADRANLGVAANFLLLHAPVLIGLSLLPDSRLVRGAGYALLAGLVLFAGDLALRDLAGTPLFALAAPLGGVGLIAGWALVAVTGLFAWRRG